MLNVFYEVAAFAPTVFERTIMMLIRSSYGKSRQSCAAKVAVYLPQWFVYVSALYGFTVYKKHAFCKFLLFRLSDILETR
jgi:hypothetical protein